MGTSKIKNRISKTDTLVYPKLLNGTRVWWVNEDGILSSLDEDKEGFLIDHWILSKKTRIHIEFELRLKDSVSFYFFPKKFLASQINSDNDSDNSLELSELKQLEEYIDFIIARYLKRINTLQRDFESIKEYINEFLI